MAFIRKRDIIVFILFAALCRIQCYGAEGDIDIYHFGKTKLEFKTKPLLEGEKVYIPFRESEDAFRIDTRIESCVAYEKLQDGTVQAYFRQSPLKEQQENWEEKDYSVNLESIKRDKNNLVFFAGAAFNEEWVYPLSQNLKQGKFMFGDGVEKEIDFLKQIQLYGLYEEADTKAVTASLTNKHKIIFVSTDKMDSSLLNKIQKYEDRLLVDLQIPRLAIPIAGAQLAITEKGVFTNPKKETEKSPVGFYGVSYIRESYFDKPFYYFIINEENHDLICGGVYGYGE